MGVPFEALLPYGIVISMFGVTGAGLWVSKRFMNEGKKNRWNSDLWDRQSQYRPLIEEEKEVIEDGRIKEFIYTNHLILAVMERDLRITGSLRGQSSNHIAPKGFEVSNPWKLEKRIY
ncbi:hypothetical protein N7528_004773 [Penicillium herquei]|nr:hypothetical protein N7528_004773 [Penicillium herquei]